MPHKRKNSEVWQIRVQGRRLSSETTDYTAAAVLEKRLNAEAWAQDKMGVRAAKTWADLCAKWTEERRHKASFADDERIMAWWSGHFSPTLDIRQITRDLVDTTVQKHRAVQPAVACSANSTANHYVNILSAMLNAACREWAWTEGSPKLRRYPMPDGRERWLEVTEWIRLHAELPQHLKWPATFALATGLREEKVFALEWAQVDMKRRSLTFKGTANKLGNTIPLNATAVGVLEAIRRSDQIHLVRVFTWLKPRKVGDVLSATVEPLQSYGKAWWKAQERAGLGRYVEGRWDGDVCWHTLRHTFASWLGQAGVPAGVIDRLGGWSGASKRGATRERYTHLNVEHLRPYAAVIDRVLAGEAVQLLQVRA